MTELSLDFETRSTVDLRATGVYPYAVHRTTGIWCFAWAFDDEEPATWQPDVPFPARIREHIEAGGTIRAWNAQFERIMWRDHAVPLLGFPVVQHEQWVCTMAEALAMGLPGSLDRAAQVTGVPSQKDAEGYGLMLRMARPRRIEADGTPVWWDVAERKARLYAYCEQDVRTERALSRVLRRLTADERKLYLLDQRINDRGIGIDRALVQAAQAVVNEGVERANLVMAQTSAGTIGAVTETGNIKRWLAEQGVDAPSIAKAPLQELLSSDLSDDVRAVLTARAEAGKSSVAKLQTMLNVAGGDDRLRGLLQFHGASTGRWAGRLVQPQNFPKGDVPDIEAYIPAVAAQDYEGIDLFTSPVRVVSSMLRSMLAAPPDYTFIAGDLSGIEAVSLNWLAGQDDVVENFRAYFAGDKDRDPYRRNAAQFYRIPLAQVQKLPHRHTGKFIELGFGYGMGEAKAVASGKAIYGIEISLEDAKRAKAQYRETHSAVVEFWYAANEAAINAVQQPGSIQVFGAHQNLRFTQQGKYLYLLLPARRPVLYAAPQVVWEPPPWGGDPRPGVTFSGLDIAHQWGRMRLYGGLIVENIVQAFSRDILVAAMWRLEAAGYPIVLTVHDEIVTERRVAAGSLEEFSALLEQPPAWASTLPIKSEVWRGTRYRK